MRTIKSIMKIGNITQQASKGLGILNKKGI